MKIAEVSKLYGVTADSLRYYERIGLLSRVPRTPSGIRDYGEPEIERIKFVKCMRDAGMPVEALCRYVQLLEQGGGTIQERKQLLIQERDNMQARIDEMQKGVDRLNYKIDNYEALFGSGKRK